jgi:hypothetical protein
MTTVGYGDYYMMSHCGRVIGICSAFWGVFFTSMFVVSLTNSLDFDSSEQKAFNLLYRLQLKERQKIEACGMLATKYKILLIRRKKNYT